MKLIDAVSIARLPAEANGLARRFFLVCGFEPLHLTTFLRAHLRLRATGRGVDVLAGVFGDLPGNLRRAREAGAEAAVAVIEWTDLDVRLGVRQAGAWTPKAQEDILGTVDTAIGVVRTELEALSLACPVALALPTLPLPPLASTPMGQLSAFEAELARRAAGLASWAASRDRLRVVNPEQLGEISPLIGRRDLNTELFSGFPYSHTHADALAASLASLLIPAAPKKGLITDLDDTLWRGILGEVGPGGVRWDLAHRSQVHAIYQRVLTTLASRGILVGVASKNDPELVAEALQRADLGLDAGQLFPICAHWRPKSISVSEILHKWNIAADSVVFVDDSPLELAEVRSVHPDIECVLFPREPQRLTQLLGRLRDWFGKPLLQQEDVIRSQSLRSAEIWQDVTSGDATAYERFLASAEQRTTIDIGGNDARGRAFELVNKTNQFNLNGRRYTVAEWEAYLSLPGSFLATVAYTDKFGPLGGISSALGRVSEAEVRLDAWVLSCRAFGRRIEHQFLSSLFAGFVAKAIVFDYVETPRNGPIREFLNLFHEPSPNLRISRDVFVRACPALHHAVEVNVR